MKCSVEGCDKEKKIKGMCSAHYQRFNRYGNTDLRGRGAKPKHGMKNTPTYKTWVHMKYRCLNPRSRLYPNYGGRGIKVCKEWMSFEGFLKDMGVRPEGTTIDRVDNDGDYTPNNCRWATQKTQQNNKRSNDKISHSGVTMNLSQWADAAKVPRSTFFNRIYTLGWSMERAVGGKSTMRAIVAAAIGDTVEIPEELLQ